MAVLKRYIWEPWGRLLRQPAFLICVLLLGLSAAGLRAGAKWLQWNLRKEAVPLRKRLEELDQSQLGRYKFIKEILIRKEIEAELGTEEYINWVLEDTGAAAGDPTRYLHLFVGYYTGDPDKVAHVPEVCSTAGGALVENGKDTDIWVPHCGAEDNQDRLPIRVLDVKAQDNQGNMNQAQSIVGYFFSVKGDYCCTRTQVRIRANNFLDRYAYYSKVEISFTHEGDLTRARALEAMERFCQTLVPILWQEHWPDWPSLEQRR